jgi:hypothetical protein
MSNQFRRSRIMKMTLKAMGAIASLLIGLSGHALADTNTYAGVLCEPISAATPFQRSTSFGMGNPSSTFPATYLCPLVRDNLPALLPLAQATVRVRDFTTSGEIVCNLTSRNQDGVSLGGSTKKTSELPGGLGFVGFTSLTFAPLPTVLTGYLTLSCTLPRNPLSPGQGTSRVISYRAAEL